MNIYDRKPLHCSKCDKFIGEVDYDAEITLPKCGRCANLIPENDDKITYMISKYQNFPTAMVIKK